jgi:segregation and condensation protein B
MPLSNQLEAILFTAARPFTIKRLAELLDASSKDVEEALVEFEKRLESSALMIQRVGAELLLVTRPEYAEAVQKIAKDEVHGELTRAALEALTILAYRGPLTRPELEQIRGVHSSMILRNLLLRGLVEEKEDTRLGQPVYAVTSDYVRHLGLRSLEDLPNYEELRGHSNVVDVLKDMEPQEERSEGRRRDENSDLDQQGVDATTQQTNNATNLNV